MRVTTEGSEQQAVEPERDRHADLVIEVIGQTQEVNKNLGSILNRTDAVVRRQNWLTVLFIVSLALNLVQISMGLSMQQVAHAAKVQLSAIDLGREELLTAVQLAKKDVETLRGELAAVKPQLLSVPTVTTDSKGRVNLELPIDAKATAAQQVVTGETKAPATLVIPLKPKESRVTN